MKKLLIVICILWAGFIFYNSSNTGSESNKRSYSIVKIIEKTVVKLNIPKLKITGEKDLNYVVRKNAHFFQYLVLAIFTTAIFFACNFKGRKAVIYILFISLLIPVIDEFYQKFIPGRTSNILDIIIDFAGGIVGMGNYYLFYYKIFRMDKENEINSRSIIK